MTANPLPPIPPISATSGIAPPPGGGDHPDHPLSAEWTCSLPVGASGHERRQRSLQRLVLLRREFR